MDTTIPPSALIFFSSSGRTWARTSTSARPWRSTWMFAPDAGHGLALGVAAAVIDRRQDARVDLLLRQVPRVARPGVGQGFPLRPGRGDNDHRHDEYAKQGETGRTHRAPQALLTWWNRNPSINGLDWRQAWSYSSSLLLLQAPPATCLDAADCRAQAQAAVARGDFEVFHDLAWRAVQKGTAERSRADAPPGPGSSPVRPARRRDRDARAGRGPRSGTGGDRRERRLPHRPPPPRPGPRSRPGSPANPLPERRTFSTSTLAPSAPSAPVSTLGT